MSTSALRDRPIATPSTTATNITRTVAIRVIDKVTIESFHSPTAKMTARQTTEELSGFQPPRTNASARMTAAISHHGESARRFWKGLMSQLVTSFFSASVKFPTLSTNQLVKSLMYLVIDGPSIGSRKGHVLLSGNWASTSCWRDR